MEKRAILAAVLMAALLMVYQFLFFKPAEQPAPPAQKAPATQAQQPGQTKPGDVPQPPATQPVPPQPVTPREAPAVVERTARASGPLYRVVVSSEGGRFDLWDLDYRGVKPMVVKGLLGPRGLTVIRSGASPQRVPFNLAPESLTLSKDVPRGQLVLSGEDGFGLRITETMDFQEDTYVVQHTISVENRHSVPQSVEIQLAWVSPVEWPKGQEQKFTGQHPVRTVRLVNNAATRENLDSIVPYKGPGKWVGLESEWYLSAFVPVNGGFQVFEAKHTPPAGGPASGAQTEVGIVAAISVTAGQKWEGRALSYVGPKEYEQLKQVGVGLEKSMYFGGFPVPQSYGGLPMEWLAVPVLYLMHLFYSYTHNYGLAIILLTVITKVLFFPLTLKSMTSMKAMQALQPQINALRAKYKSDPQRMQQETMALYRTHKVNPLGGCLPMIVQVPIFYALYVALSVSVELQNQPFICFGRIFGVDLWICDLAAQDPTYILPILMGVSMFIQQKMTPVMGDPRQAKMMLFMPVVFTFMFLNLPSGLVLYWTVSNVLQIAQQKYMDRGRKKQPDGAKKQTEKVPSRPAKKA